LDPENTFGAPIWNGITPECCTETSSSFEKKKENPGPFKERNQLTRAILPSHTLCSLLYKIVNWVYRGMSEIAIAEGGH